jgi:hypothetical protein
VHRPLDLPGQEEVFHPVPDDDWIEKLLDDDGAKEPSLFYEEIARRLGFTPVESPSTVAPDHVRLVFNQLDQEDDEKRRQERAEREEEERRQTAPKFNVFD